MMKQTNYFPSDNAMEDELNRFMDELSLEETQSVLSDYHVENSDVNADYINTIKQSVSIKTGLNLSDTEETNTSQPPIIKSMKKKGTWNRWVAVIVILLIGLSVWQNSDSIVYAVNNMFKLFPGVGIVEGNEDILYQLDKPVTMESENGILEIINVVATKTEISVNFSYTKKNYNEEEELKKKQEEWEKLEQTNQLAKPNISLMIGKEEYLMSCNSIAGGGETDFISASITLEEEKIKLNSVYELSYHDYSISIPFSLKKVNQFNSVNDIGPSETKNNISLTATARIEDNQLKVNVYPINYSKYELISFISEYNMNYFGDKISLQTEKGEKDYTLPDSYGSGMNATYSFDVSDGAKDYLLHIPGILVQSKEEKGITLPIPEEDQTIQVNKKVEFEDGTLIITSVRKAGKNETGNGYGSLNLYLKYSSKNENQQLIGVNVTRNRSEGWSEELLEDGRLLAINYMLEKGDKDKIKFKVVRPRYVFADEYNLKLNP